LPEYKRLGRRLLGVVINKVPLSKLSFVKEQAAIQMPPASGIQLLGIIPEDRLLYSMTIAGLAELFQGKILNNTEKSGELIENYMLGALVFDSGEEYFKRKKNKAVILKSERPDMQLAALQTSLRCMVISGPVPPIPAVTQLARIKKVPLISTSGEVMNLISTLEAAAARRKFNQEQKLPLLMNAFKGNLDLNLFDAILDPAVK